MSRRPATTTANNNTTNNSPCKFSLVRTNSPMAPFLPLLSLSLLVLCNATGQNEQQQQQQQMTVQQQTTVLHLCQQFPDLDICQPVGSMEKRKSAYMRFGKRKSAYMRFGKRATGEEADLGMLLDDNDDQEQESAMAALEKRKSAYMRLGKRKSAYMRFGRK